MDEIRKVKRFRVVNLGREHPQYFTGAGVALTEWEESFVGVADTLAKALQNAIDCAADDWEFEEGALLSDPKVKEISKDNTEAHELLCLNDYVSLVNEGPARNLSFEDWHTDCELAWHVVVYVSEFEEGQQCESPNHTAGEMLTNPWRCRECKRVVCATCEGGDDEIAPDCCDMCWALKQAARMF